MCVLWVKHESGVASGRTPCCNNDRVRHRDDHHGGWASPAHPRDHGREPLPVDETRKAARHVKASYQALSTTRHRQTSRRRPASPPPQRPSAPPASPPRRPSLPQSPQRRPRLPTMRRALTTSRILLFEQTVTTTHDSGCHHR